METPGALLEQVQHDNDFYKSIIANNSFYIIKTDLLGNYSYMNPFFLQRFSLEAPLWIGKPSLHLILPVDHQLCIDTVALCFEHPQQTHWVVLRKPCQEEILYTEWEFSLLFDNEGAPSEILCIGHDITSQILKQEELRALVDVTSEQNNRLVNFTYIISHNIRSHVANIMSIMDLSEAEDQAQKAVL